MNKKIALAACAASLLVPTAANAQAVPAAVIAVVDLDKVTSDCNSCKTASASLRGKATALQNQAKSLAAPLETEGKAIQAAIDALKGAEPDAALKTRAQAFDNKRQSAAATYQRGQEQLQRDQAYIQKQIGDKLGPIYQQVMQKRGANVLLEVGSTLATSNSVDVTADVTAGLNAVLPSIATTAPAAPAQQKPQGR
ncbi:MAG TPA: OmpH family outer membrane protein [Sphingomicrobium sp.]|nr:OmpH family outer membrane protein [Sphingomicrobium sp.]